MQGSSSSQHGSSTSGRQHCLGLLAKSQGTRGEGDSEDDWASLINPHISQEERDELLSDDSQSEVDEEDRYIKERSQIRLKAFWTLPSRNKSLPKTNARSG